MISKWMPKYCSEPINLIENYDKAINDDERTWVCHHKLEIELNKTHKELKEADLYYNRPAKELIFMTKSDHNKLHHRGQHYSLGKCGKRGKDKKKRKTGSGIYTRKPIIKEKINKTPKLKRKPIIKEKINKTPKLKRKNYIKPIMLIRSKTFNKEYTYWSKEEIMLSYLKFRSV